MTSRPRVPRYAMITLAAAVSVAASEAGAAPAACKPAVAGSTINWAYEVCMTRAETDDEGSEVVLDCVHQLHARDKIPQSPASNCRLNEFYKREWCAYFVKLEVEKSVQACVQSVTSKPRSVTEGF